VIRCLRFYLLCSLLAFSACSLIFGDSEAESGETEGGVERYPDLVMRTFIRSAVDRSGHLLWQIKAREGRVFSDINQIYITDFIFYSFESDGSLSSTLRARRGIMDNNASTLAAKLDVVLRSENGRVLETEEIFANNNEKVVTNSVLNRITQEDGTVMIGTHLWAHSDLEVFKLQGAIGEAPEGAEDSILGEEEKGSSSSSSSSSSGSRGGAGERGSSSSRSPGTGGGAGPAGGQADRLLPNYDEESLEQLRDEIAFPKGAYTVPQEEEYHAAPQESASSRGSSEQPASSRGSSEQSISSQGSQGSSGSAPAAEPQGPQGSAPEPPASSREPPQEAGSAESAETAASADEAKARAEGAEAAAGATEDADDPKPHAEE